MKKMKKKWKKRLKKSQSSQSSQSSRTQSPNYIKWIKKEIDYIKPYENEDLEWYNEGYDLLDRNLLTEAELKFKELVLSQPKSQDGYEGLANLYEKTGDKEKAIYFLNKAIELSKEFLSEDRISERYDDLSKRINKM